MYQANVVTALPHAFYPELSWRDDLEWAAAELALAGQALGATRVPRAGCATGRGGRPRTSRTRRARTR